MEELYTLTIELVSGRFAEHPWKRVIEVPETADLYDLHLFIQRIIGFDNDHLFEFYAGRHRRNRKRVFGDDEDFGFEEREGFDTMLNQVFPLDRLTLFYCFDFGDMWTFMIKKGRKRNSVEQGVEYPRVIEADGKSPQQYPNFDD